MMEGLANSFAKKPSDEMVMEVIMLLKQGATPEELVSSGVPARLIEQAIAIINAEQKAMQAQSPEAMMAEDPNAGLAAKLGRL
jgi:hypothetical protein